MKNKQDLFGNVQDLPHLPHWHYLKSHFISASFKFLKLIEIHMRRTEEIDLMRKLSESTPQQVRMLLLDSVFIRLCGKRRECAPLVLDVNGWI